MSSSNQMKVTLTKGMDGEFMGKAGTPLSFLMQKLGVSGSLEFERVMPDGSMRSVKGYTGAEDGTTTLLAILNAEAVDEA
ncbi:uncharacterized protein AMSG_09730 [Thecamonas trahens ATCC 50062]|uniref:Uncharacterized protein n=1 Tax=Thecamonas trahens ATCC 50062 TaxID=461836 RepID=A0A0L0DP91_THETB|nr:hypothetical protein AMSG_09730 [Thecamonas trahens ATCC 50062]KNC54065.1 hypothetical protein AMSG_09730 [Thecamonas trahens ATCC 50062]|eukprot:XP_013754074.1 hypothetical protein AMSG_09730 [Thecamonas trahens ATCC 50062]